MAGKCLYLIREVNGYPITAQAVCHFDKRVYRNGKKYCWRWDGLRNGGGYGTFAWRYGKQFFLDAHRFSWLIYRGEIPSGLHVCHHCDNRRCVRPDHLFLGTRSDNMQDCIAKGRLKRVGMKCEENPNAKLSWAKVNEIRSRWKKRIVTAEMLAKEYGISKGQCHLILQGKSWVKQED